MVMMNHKFFIFGNAYVELEHMRMFLVFLKSFDCVLWSFPTSSTMSDAELFIGIYKVVERFVAISISSVKNVWEAEEEGWYYPEWYGDYED